MGAASTTRFIKNNAGALTEQAAVTTSAGAGDANAIPALNASGVLDSSIVNSKTTSGGATDSGKVVALDASGRIDSTMLPVGIGADTASIIASENISAGNLVNIWNDTGTPKIRKADATTAGKEAHGFVLTAVNSGNNGTVYFEGTNTAVTGITAGTLFLATTAGITASTAPTSTGNVVQRVGFGVSSTAFNFQSQTPVTLA